MNNNIIVNVDTDSILIAKPDGSEWTEVEQNRFMEALNKIFPEKIKFEHDGYFDAVLVLASKNYILKEQGEEDLKIKGSALKDQKKEPALKDMLDDIIYAFINNELEDIPKIYDYYVQEALNVQDIMRWSQKKTVTEPILACNGAEPRIIKDPETGKEKKVYFKNDRPTSIRSNEFVLWEAIKDEELMQQGDKFYTFPAVLSTSIETKTYKNGKTKEKVVGTYGCLQPKHWTGRNHDVEHLLKRLYNTLEVFHKVLDMKQYKNYSLAKNYKELLDKQPQ